jgi:hypothetical protein
VQVGLKPEPAEVYPEILNQSANERQWTRIQMNLNTSIESRQDAKHAKKTASKAEMAGGYGYRHPPIALGAIVFSWRAWRLGESKSP